MTSQDVRALLEPVRRLHELIRAAVVEACERASLEELSGVERDEEGDTIYAVDRVGEEVLIEFFEREVAAHAPLVLIAEGLEGGQVVLPRGAREDEAVWRVVVDPIDGTRALMYQKRSGWALTGVAPNRGPTTGLRDIELAVQTEIPLVKQHLCDALWAARGGGARAERMNRLTGERMPLTLRPSRARTIAHGFAQVARFFPGARDVLAAIDEEVGIRFLRRATAIRVERAHGARARKGSDHRGIKKCACRRHPGGVPPWGRSPDFRCRRLRLRQGNPGQAVVGGQTAGGALW